MRLLLIELGVRRLEKEKEREEMAVALIETASSCGQRTWGMGSRLRGNDGFSFS
jgi:hypothetical protein